MALFDEKSRYVRPALETYSVIDTRGREVRALAVPEHSREQAVGRHLRREGQTLDQLASAYLDDPHAYYRICELNDAILPDALEEREMIEIPSPVR